MVFGMGLFGDAGKKLSGAWEWTKEQASAGAKLVADTYEAAKDKVEKVVETITEAPSAVEKAAKPVTTLANQVSGVNSFTEKASYAWKKASEMTKTLANVASVISPTFAATRAIVNLGANTFKVGNDTLKILDKSTSVTSVLNDKAWGSALKKSAEAKIGKDAGAEAGIDTDKILENLPKKGDDASKQETEDDANGEVVRHVKAEEWRRILASEKTAADEKSAEQAVPGATIDGHGITFHPDEKENNKKAEEEKATDDKNTAAKGKNKDVNGKSRDKARVELKDGKFVAYGPDGVQITSHTDSLKREALDNGKGWRQNADGSQEWDIHDDQKVVRRGDMYYVYDRSNNLLGKYSKSQVDGIEETLSDRTRIRRIEKRIDEIVNKFQLPGRRQPGGRIVGAASDGLFMEDEDGTLVVLKFDGNAYFQIDKNTRIWKDADNKYFLCEEGKEPEPIVEGVINRRLQRRTAAYLKILEQFAKEGQFLHNGVKFTLENGQATAEVQQKEGDNAGQVVGTLQANKRESKLTREGALSSTFIIAERKVVLGEDNEKTTIDLKNDVVETPYVITNREGTTIKRTGDWVGLNGDVRLADGTEFVDGKLIAGDDKLKAEQAQADAELKQAAKVIQEATCIAEQARCKAQSGTITYAVVSALDVKIDKVIALKNQFADNELVIAQLNKILGGLEASRAEARESFAANTMLRAMRDAALSGTYGNAAPQSIVTTQAAHPEMRLQFRFRPEIRLTA
ncbi:MAG TPA: hypothetical protein V6D17_10460 [Candidatus Obscuribacterales bacterium]